jgi:hypothetical protein
MGAEGYQDTTSGGCEGKRPPALLIRIEHAPTSPAHAMDRPCMRAAMAITLESALGILAEFSANIALPH